MIILYDVFVVKAILFSLAIKLLWIYVYYW